MYVTQHRSKPRDDGKGMCTDLTVAYMGPSAPRRALRVQRSQSLMRWITSEEARRRKIVLQTELECRKLILAAVQTSACG